MVFHKNHRDSHEKTFRLGERFPTCKVCGDQVTFELVLGAENDPDLA